MNGVVILIIIVFGIMLVSSFETKSRESNNLEDWQKDLVNKGLYDSTSFDEEDLEEDDYYNEDDN